MASSNEPDQGDAVLEKRLQQLVAALDNEALGEVLREIGGGNELAVARAMIRRANKK